MLYLHEKPPYVVELLLVYTRKEGESYALFSHGWILDCLLYFGGAHTIQDFFEFLLFGKLYAKTHFTTVIHGVWKLQKVTKISFPV